MFYDKVTAGRRGVDVNAYYQSISLKRTLHPHIVLSHTNPCTNTTTNVRQSKNCFAGDRSQ